MSFASFLHHVEKIAFGYIGGFLLLMTGAVIMAQGDVVLGGVVAFIGIILGLFGVYNKRSMRQ